MLSKALSQQCDENFSKREKVCGATLLTLCINLRVKMMKIYRKIKHLEVNNSKIIILINNSVKNSISTRLAKSTKEI